MLSWIRTGMLVRSATTVGVAASEIGPAETETSSTLDRPAAVKLQSRKPSIPAVAIAMISLLCRRLQPQNFPRRTATGGGRRWARPVKQAEVFAGLADSVALHSRNDLRWLWRRHTKV